MTNPSGTPTSIPGASRSRNPVGASSLVERSLASASTVASFASSEGWNLKAPKPIQLLVPSAVPAPVPITKVAASKTSAITYAGIAAHSHQRRGIRATSVNTSNATANHRTCRCQASVATGSGVLTAPAE